MKLSEDLTWRGLIKDRTFADVTWLDGPKSFYHGVDASADSLHIGNLAALITAKRLINAGWKAVLLAGGATSLIGDPKDNEERELKPREEIEKNVAAIKEQINQLFAGQQFTLVDNYDWFNGVGYLDFLRDVGKNFAMSELMQREFITERLSSGISYAEFSYSLIQGYDYWQLYKNHDTVLQIGGSDQWGNMLSGVSLIRKKEGKEVQALSMPLVVNKSTGRKFGKSEEGTIWLDSTKTNETEFYQFWLNTEDADVEDYLKVFTLLPRQEVEVIINKHKAHPEVRMAQATLAEEVTELVHGSEGREIAQGSRTLLASVNDMLKADEKTIVEVKKQLPYTKSGPSGSIVTALVVTHLASSNSDARRLLASGAIYINDKQTGKEFFEGQDFQNGRLLLRRGKAFKDSALVELE